MSVIFDHKTGTGYSASSGTYYSFKNAPVKSAAADEPAATHTNPSPNKLYTTSSKYFPWGLNNLYPQDVTKLIPKVTIGKRMLNHHIRKIYGKGIVPSHVEIDSDGNKKYTPTKDPVILDFFKRNNLRRFMLETIVDYVWFGNSFPEIILNKKRNKITNIYPNEASYCRWELQNEKTSLVENCYVSANWPNPADDEIKIVPALDMYDPMTALYDGNKYKYILDQSFPSPDKFYYQEPHWDGEGTRDWMKIAIAVPKIMLSGYENGAVIRWHVRIPYEHWERVFSQISPKLSKDEEMKFIDAEIDKIDKFLTGTENAHKMFVSHFGTDPITKKELPGWEIIPLDDKVEFDKHLPNSAAANSEILFAGAEDPSEMGAGMPGGPYSQGNGGSNKREGFLISTALLQPDRDAVVEILNICRDFNRWDPTVEFPFIDTILTTLDQGSGTKKTLS